MASPEAVVRSNGVGEVEIEIDVQGSLHRAWGASATDVWVTGDRGVMVHFAP